MRTPTRKPPLWHFGYSDDIRMQGHYNVAREADGLQVLACCIIAV